jgi:16S rRNA (guanine527-N7)-methyltransferase
MEIARIAELLRPFLAGPLAESQLRNISMYIDILLRWNARINLTAVRAPETIVTRHFGESLFAARHLFPGADRVGAGGSPAQAARVIDLGSGAGFPGLPIKIWAPQLRVTLIEANQRKATFLREVIRALSLTDAEAFSARAETFPPGQADVVTLRAVERFDVVLPIAVPLLAPGGRLALLIGEAQGDRARQIASPLCWADQISIPLSSSRVLLIGTQEST